MTFTCNVCGNRNEWSGGSLDREQPSCARCKSNVRMRAVVHALSQELFGVSLRLTDFPLIKSLRGIGLSDANQYAERLAERFDYRNTFFDREPRLDITNPGPEHIGQYDFLIASEVFEHVAPPVERAFEAAHRLLKPSGVLILTVPYSLEKSTVEHYPASGNFGVAQVDGQTVVVRRKETGEFEVFDRPVFHIGCSGAALEMREFSEAGLRDALGAAGFGEVRVCSERYEPFGIAQSEPWSLPIVARKGSFVLGREAVRDAVTDWQRLIERFGAMARSRWFRLGARMGWY